MSQEASLVFELERRRREQLFRARVESKTREFYMRYQNQYENMCSQGYLDYIPEEMGRLEQDLNTIGRLLTSDPVSARQVSQEVSSYIHGLWGLGKEARQVFQESAHVACIEAKREKEKAQIATLSRYYDIIGGLDSITANFAGAELADIKNGVISGAIADVSDVEAKLQPIISKAKNEAANWKAQKQQEQEKQAVIAQIEEQKESVKAEKFEDNSKAQEILSKLEEIKRRTTADNISTKEVKEQIESVAKETDAALVGEEVRRETVKAVYKWFKSHDFSLSKPKLIDGAVVITAQRPSGNKAQFKLTLDNKMWYRLDGYEGQSCLKDISSAKADWESVYGIHLSDEVVKWQNPDRILRQQGQTETDIGGNA